MMLWLNGQQSGIVKKEETMGIKEDFLNFTKWGANKFTDLFTIPFVNGTNTDGLKWHLQEIRQKTYDAIAALVDGKVDTIKVENNVKVVQGTPIGGQIYIGHETKTGALKISLPNAKDDVLSYFEIELFSTIPSNKPFKFLITCYENSGGFGRDGKENNRVVVLGNYEGLNIPVSFCTGNVESYILLGTPSSTWSYSYIKISNLMYKEIVNTRQRDWSKGWNISIITELEALDELKKITILPSLNSTHLNGTMSSNAQGGVTQKKSSTNAFAVVNDAEITCFKVDTISNSTVINRQEHRTSFSYDGAGVIPTIANLPQYGDVFAYDTNDVSKFCRYNFYKKDSSSSPVFQLIQNEALTIVNTNPGGTIVIAGGSNNYKITVRIFVA